MNLTHTGNGVIKCLFGQVTSLIWCIEDLIVENGEVQGETETDWVRWSEVSVCDFSGSLVGFERFVGRGLALIASGELS